MAYYSHLVAFYTEYSIEELSSNERVWAENKALFVNSSLRGSSKIKTKMCRHAHADSQRYNNCCINRQTHTAIHHRLAYCGILWNTDRALTDTQPHWNTWTHTHTHTHCTVWHAKSVKYISYLFWCLLYDKIHLDSDNWHSTEKSIECLACSHSQW